MNHWTHKRRLSLLVHSSFVSIPFVLSTASAVLFWQTMFGSWPLAVAMVAVLDLLALTGLVLYIARIPSPFVAMRHLLPFISIVPLGRELYLLLAHNDPWLAWSLTALTTGVFVVVAWQCFRTIEALWIDPVSAAREQAREQVSVLETKLAQLTVLSEAADSFAVRRLSAALSVATADDDRDDSASVSVVSVSRPQLTRQQAATLATRLGVSERTIWRQAKAGKLTADDIEE